MFKRIVIGFTFGLLLTAGAGLAEVVVAVRPPAAIVETRPVAPGAGYVWVKGYHRWDGHAYVWMPGTWVRPPRPGVHWVDHQWVHRGHGWVFVEGHWR